MVAVAGILLAAGAGRRYGMPKALVTYDGGLLVEHGLATLRDGGAEPLIVVLGAQHDEVLARADLAGANVVVNADWDTGMGSSLRTGLGALSESAADAAAILLVDTPGITPAAVRRIIERGAPAALVAATYGGELGHPVLLGRDHWPGVIQAAIGDRGARPYLRAHRDLVAFVPCDDVASGEDLDTPPEAG
ncbi:MAG TPA: nucleotidyltransferase family protein [Micromonosporaceae bacterium]|jgi:nicotine blue oxidoreductase|nr:nucleotidyltransferase family protein [Micromonosporaceae bacterium]